MLNVVNKYMPKEYTSFCTNRGVILWDKQEGAFLVLRFKEDLENLKKLLDKIEVIDQEK